MPPRRRRLVGLYGGPQSQIFAKKVFYGGWGAYLGLADNSCGPLLSPVEPSEGSLSTGCQVSKRVVNPLCSPPFLLVDIPIPRRWMSFFLVHPLPYLGLRPRRHPVEQHFFE